MTELRRKKCTPCEGGIPPMTLEEATAMQRQVPGWEVGDDGQVLRRVRDFCRDRYFAVFKDRMGP